MANNRILKIDGEIKRALFDILHNDVKDPRMSDMAPVSRVNVTQDLKYAKVYVSIFDTDERKKASIEALKNAEGFIRSRLNDKIKLRRIPIMEFVLDDSIEYGVRMSKLIDEVNSGIEQHNEKDN